MIPKRGSGAKTVERTPFSQRVLNIGFLAALVLAALAFAMAAFYLQRYADSTQAVVSEMLKAGHSDRQIAAQNLELLQNSLAVHAYVARVLLVSCGMFIALAFGFLGFALFLVGATGQSDMAAEASEKLRLTLTGLAPGTVAIVAATVLAGLCATRALPADFSFGANSRNPIVVAPPPTNADAAVNKALQRPDPKMP